MIKDLADHNTNIDPKNRFYGVAFTNCQHGLTLNPAWPRNHMPNKVYIHIIYIDIISYIIYLAYHISFVMHTQISNPGGWL